MAADTRPERLRNRIVGASAHAWARVTSDGWPLVQGTLAATLAWVIAVHVAGHPDPFFAPMAAVVALNTSRGKRGVNALWLLLGVVVGIVVGELTVSFIGGGYGGLALATFVALAIARALSGSRLVLAQAATGAILTVAVGDGQAGPNRLIDALIGAGIALVFSQLLFTPEPVALVRRAEEQALTGIAAGLDLTARALEHDDDDLGDQAMSKQRDSRDHLTDLAQMRKASSKLTRRSLTWRTQIAPAVQEQEDAGHLDLLGDSCLMLTRTTIATSTGQRRAVAPSVRKLADLLAGMVDNIGDRKARQQAADRALDLSRQLADDNPETEPLPSNVTATLDMVTVDVMVFAGAQPDQALAAVREGTRQLQVPAPPKTPIPSFLSKLRRRWRHREP